MNDDLNYCFSKIACHAGGSFREPIALFFQKWTPCGQLLFEDALYCYPACGQIESYQTSHIHGYETSPVRRLHNIDTGEYVTTQSRLSIADTIANDYADDSVLLCWGYQNGQLIEEWASKAEEEEEDDQGFGQIQVDFPCIIDLQQFFTEYMGYEQPVGLDKVVDEYCGDIPKDNNYRTNKGHPYHELEALVSSVYDDPDVTAALRRYVLENS